MGHISAPASPHYARLKVSRVYEGVDLVFYGNDGNLEYDFEVAPSADLRKIRLVFEGQESLSLDADSGALVVTARGGFELRQLRPRIYQRAGGR